MEQENIQIDQSLRETFDSNFFLPIRIKENISLAVRRIWKLCLETKG